MGLAIGRQFGGAVGGGPGLAASLEVGVLLDGKGLTLYTTDTKLPTHCEDKNGDPELCSKGVGAAAGVGWVGHLVLDADAAEGAGRSATLDTPAGSVGMSFNDDKITSIDVGVGPSVGAAMHVDHVVTEYD